MTVLNIEGRKVQVDDSFLKLSPEQQNAQVEEIARSLNLSAPAGEPPTTPDNEISTTNVARAAARGVPVLGGLADKANAAINATLAPIIDPLLPDQGYEKLPGETWGQRYDQALGIEKRRDKAFDEANPVTSTAAQIAGGVGGSIPAVLAAPKFFGAVGTLPQMVRRGAGSGALVAGVDAITRGDDPVTGAEVGGVMGAVAPVAGRAIGKAVQAIRGQRLPTEPLNTAPVAGVDVPIPSSDPATAQRIEAARRGGMGDPAQRVVQQADELANDRLRQAADNIAMGLDPNGNPRTLPQSAAERVSSELGALEQQRFQTEQAAAQRAGIGGRELLNDVGTPGAPGVDSPYAAGEAIGAGVAARRAAAVADRNARYQAVSDLEGTFDPSVPRSMSEQIRQRLNQGAPEERIWVDPDSTSVANQALKLIDNELGMFENAAAVPRSVPSGAISGEAAPAAAPAASSEAANVLAELERMGINPKRARDAVRDIPGGDALPAARGPSLAESHKVSVPGGGEVEVKPKVVELDSIRTSADAGYDPRLQPRDRARAASTEQIGQISRNLNPQRLGLSTEADRGAPIIGPDGMVESGNGRVMALRQASPEKVAEYRQWLRDQGIDTAGMKNPVLVRERVTPMSAEERAKFAVQANQSSTLSLSAAERALADAKALQPDTLRLIRNPSDLAAVDNRDFVRAFVKGLPAEERGAMMTAGGDLSAEGLTRVRNAVLARAYGDSPVLGRVAEATSDEIRSISRALTEAAPEWAQLRAAIASGRVPAEFDQTPALLDAVSRTAAIRSRGGSLESSLAQTDAFARRSPESEVFQRMFYDADGARAASSSKIADGLRHYAQEAAEVDAAPGLDLGMGAVKPGDILKLSSGKIGAPAALARSVDEATQEAARAASVAEGPALSLREMDSARKRLVVMYGDAKKAALAPGGSAADQRAMGRILNEFDNTIIDAIDSGKFTGDPELAKRLMAEARASHAAYRERFTSRGPSDEIGRAVEKIIGRYADSAATPAEIASMAFGSASDPGGAKSIKIAQRLRQVLGPTSPEWGNLKQGLFSHITRTEPGQSARSFTDTADRIDRFLTGTNGRGLAQVVFEPPERARLANYAQQLRAAEPMPINKLSDVDKIVARISGRDGGIPASTTEVIDFMYGRTGAGSKGLSVRLAQRLQQDLSPEGWNEVRQGMWAKLTNAGEGKTEWGPQKVSQRLYEFLNESGKPLAHVLFKPHERAEMLKLADALRANAPIPGTTNPSGTASMLARMGSRILHAGLPVAGFAQGGISGALAGFFVDKGLTSAMNARAARQVQRLVYGAPPSGGPVDPRYAQAAVLLSQGARPALVGAGQR